MFAHMLTRVMGNANFILPRNDALGRLTEKQCECLELVLGHLTSKQIAMQLGISPHTVNQRLDIARKTLGATTRLDAAVQYARLKGIPESLVYHSDDDYKYQEISAHCESPPPQRTVYDPVLLAHPGQVPVGIGTPDDSGVLILEDSSRQMRSAPWDQDAVLRPFAGTLAGTNETVRRLVMILGLSVLMMMVIILGIALAVSLTGALVHS